MKKLVVAFGLVLAGSNPISAQGTNGLGKSDPDAKKVLDAVSAKFKTFKTVIAKFALKIENAQGSNVGSKSGSVFMKGTKYHISVTGQEIFCDGSNVWTFDKASNEVTINKLDPGNITITPQKLFTNFYDKDFLYKLNTENKGVQVIELTPVDKGKPFHKVLVYINKTSQTISSTKVFEKTGNRYTYTVGSMNTNSNITDNQFVFDQKKYPGVEVVDLR